MEYDSKAEVRRAADSASIRQANAQAEKQELENKKLSHEIDREERFEEHFNSLSGKAERVAGKVANGALGLMKGAINYAAEGERKRRRRRRMSNEDIITAQSQGYGWDE